MEKPTELMESDKYYDAHPDDWDFDAEWDFLDGKEG